MSCANVGLFGVCCVMSCDEVRGVDDAVCLAVHSQKGSTAHGPVCMWWYAPMRHVVWWVVGEWACGLSWWCGGCRKKRGEEANTQSNKDKKDFSQNHFSPFPFFPPLFLPLFSPCLPLFHNHSLLIHTLTYFPCFPLRCIHDEPKTLMTQHLILFIVFSSCSNSLFSLLFLQLMIQCWCNHNPLL